MSQQATRKTLDIPALLGLGGDGEGVKLTHQIEFSTETYLKLGGTLFAVLLFWFILRKILQRTS